MEMNNVLKAYTLCIQARQPVMLWGGPGIGKTEITNAIARSLKFEMFEQVCATWDPTDVGLPMLPPPDRQSSEDVDRVVEYYERVPPKWAHEIVAKAKAGKQVLLYLDEFSCTPPAVQAATLKIVGEKKIGDLKLPDNLAIAGCANPADQAAGGWDLAPPAANRWCHLDFRLDVAGWCEGMRTGFPDPKILPITKGWENLIPSKRVLISAYIERFGSEHLYNLPDNEADAGKAWPSPRTWTRLADLLAAAEHTYPDTYRGTNSGIVLNLVRGMVGNPAVSFMTFIENLDLPDPEMLLNDPDLYQHPDRNDKAHVILNSVVAAVISKPSAKRWKAAIDIVRSAAKQGGQDLACLPARTLLKNQVSGVEIPDDIIELFPTLQAAGLVGGAR